MIVLVIGIVCVNFHHGTVQCSSSQIFNYSSQHQVWCLLLGTCSEMNFIWDLWGSYKGAVEFSCLLGCAALLSGKYCLMFQRNIRKYSSSDLTSHPKYLKVKLHKFVIIRLLLMVTSWFTEWNEMRVIAVYKIKKIWTW